MRRKLIQNYLLIVLLSIGITSAAFLLNGSSYLVRENENSLTHRVCILADSFCQQKITSVS